MVQRSNAAAVNVGRSLRALDRGGVAAALNMTCGNPPWCDANLQPQDKLWCTEAMKRGYDSIQIRHPHGNPHGDAELLVCTGCDKVALNGACPPDGVPLRRASWDKRTSDCACSNESDNLNCGDNRTFSKCEAPARDNRNFEMPLVTELATTQQVTETRSCGVRQCRSL